MRDIPNANSANIAYVQPVNSKTSSGTLTKADYKSYRDFLGNYNISKKCSKDDQESVSSTDSGIFPYKLADSKSNNTSSSSLNSEANGSTSKNNPESSASFNNRMGSFRNYLDTYNNKKFSTVKLQVPQKTNTVKSEITIQVNDPLENTNKENEIFRIVLDSSSGDKIEKPSSISAIKSVSTSLPPPPPMPPISSPRNEIFSHHNNISVPTAPPPPPPLPSPSGSLNGTIKKWSTINAAGNNSVAIKKEPNHAAANLAKVLQEHFVLRNIKSDRFDKDTTETSKHALPPPVPKSPTLVANKKPKLTSLNVHLGSETKKENSLPSSKPPIHSSTNVFKVSQKFQQKPSTDGRQFPNKPLIKTQSFNGTFNTYLPKRSNSDAFLPNNESTDRCDGIEFHTRTVIPVVDNTQNVSKSDPNVKKLVYNTYRGLLSAYNNKANDMIATLPRKMVREDRGISRQLESMAQAAAPPPPPVGHIPATRLKSEISDRKTEPPLCVQNAMLTKDKKPFTYTPGGIDLSEIRSPRMAKRLERNAMSEGVTPSVHPQNHHPPTNLPPSALAAMQPQLSVQVFPSGKVPQLHHHGGAPPPPPPPNNIPPPPRAPPLNLGAPLPKDNFDRPDMTKIIPENPLKLLRKTSGPVIKQDPIFRRDNYNNSHQNVNANNTERVEPKPVTPNTSSSGVGSIYIPPLNQNNTPPAMYKQPQSPQLIRQNENSPDVRSPPPYYKRQPSSPHAEAQSPTLVQRQQSLNASSRDPQTPESPKPSLSKAPTPWLTQPRQQPEVPKWATNEQSRMTPPTQEYQFPIKQEEPVQYRNPYQNPNQTQSSPWPNESQAWQQKPSDQYYQQEQQQQQQQQPWRQKQPEQQPWQQQSHINQSPPIQVSQKGVQKQVQNREHVPRSEPTERVEVVIVNEPPLVFQHPGQHPGQLQQRNVVRQQPPQQNSYAPQYQNQSQSNSQGVRIIPIQVEGQDSNGHDRYNNSDGRSYNRQQSWNSNPTQSGSFKVLQKITQTDGEEDDNQIITEHSPKSQHQFPQRQMSTEQPRRFRENGNNNNNFIQGPPNQHNMARGPQVRTIPIQIESDGPGRIYVPPSEQIVQEPKKYMGSSIPSRSFKMLQAMTGPEECAKTNQDCENNEIYSNDPSSYSEWGFNPNYPQPQPQPQPAPYYFDPYWGYYPPYPPSKNEPILNNSSHRTTPIPFGWRYTPPNYPTIEHSNCDTNGSKSSNLNNLYNETDSTKGQNIKHRATPVPHSMHYYPNYQYENKNLNVPQLKEQSNNDQPYPQCPQYWDPYYYYYGMPPPPPMYPPMYSPYPFYPPQQSDAEEISGYSSTDEMSYYGARFANMPPFNNPKQKPLVESHVVNANKNQKEKIEDNRHIKQEFVKKVNKFDNKIEDDSSVTETSDSDSEMTGYEVCRGPIGLQAIRSVSNIKVYEEDGSSCCSEDEREDEEEDDDNNSEDNDTLSVHTNDDAIPHQLSVIYEESERADSDMRHVREASVASTISEDTRTVENSENEDDFEDPVIVKLPLTLNFTVDNSQKVAMITVGNSEVLNSSACDNNCNGMKTFADNVEIKSDSNDLYFDENSKIQDTNQVGDITDCEDNESEVDWWGQIERTDSTAYFKRKLNNQQSEWEKEIKNSNEEEQLGTVYEGMDQTVETQENGLYSLTNLEIPEFNFTEAYRCHDIEANRCHDIEANRCHDIETNHCQYGKANIFHSDNDNTTNSININEHLDDTASIKTNKSDEVDFWAEITSSNDNIRKIVVNKGNSVCSSDSSSNSSEIAYQPNPLNGVENPKQSFYNETENNIHSIQSKSFTSTEEVAKEDYQMPSIQDRIKALQAIIALKHAQRDDEMEIKNLARDRIAVVDDTNEMLSIERNISKRRSNSRKSSVKSYDDYSEEDGDSGVTSDVSKHISEIDTESECTESRKHYQYQRVNTHSRLFKLLQGDGDENEDDDISMEINEDYQKENMQCRRNHLNLPLNKITNSDPESFSSSGFTSPGSPIINEKLVGELIQSLLQNKNNSSVLKNITLEKIQNAALKILQEDADGLENFNSSEDGGCYLSPWKPDTGNSTAAQTPQEFYTHLNDYNQYYESWADASRLSESQSDILPSKAFRLIQSHAASNRTGSIAGLLARCPRVLSNKNVQKELMRLIEMQNNLSSDPPEQIPDSNEATNAP